MARPRQGNPRPYARTARVNELVMEIVAEELERIDDERLELVTITHVSVDRDLRRATVEWARLGQKEEEAAEALGEHRVRLQAAVGRQARLKRTPELTFRTDSAIAYGARIEELLRDDPSRHRS
jgi:ribosome-binding factor A